MKISAQRPLCTLYLWLFSLPYFFIIAEKYRKWKADWKGDWISEKLREFKDFLGRKWENEKAMRRKYQL